MPPIYMLRADAHVSFIVCVCVCKCHTCPCKQRTKNCPFVAYKNNGPKNLKSISNVLAKANWFMCCVQVCCVNWNGIRVRLGLCVCVCVYTFGVSVWMVVSTFCCHEWHQAAGQVTVFFSIFPLGCTWCWPYRIVLPKTINTDCQKSVTTGLE